MEKKHYYLKDNRIWMANESKPNKSNYGELYDLIIFKRWNDSLQPCDISEGELDKIKKYITYVYDANPIEVTDIISDNNGVITFKEKSITCDKCINLQGQFNNPDCCQNFSFGVDFAKGNDTQVELIINPKQVDGEIEAVESQEKLWIEVRDIIVNEPSQVRLDICKKQFTITRNI